MKRWFRFIALIQIALGASARADATSASCESHLLRPDQCAALREAKQGCYKAVWLEGKINEISRSVVLLGEYHVKSERDSVRGLNVVSGYPVIGIETGCGLQKSAVTRALLRLVRARFWWARRRGARQSTIRDVLQLRNGNGGPSVIYLDVDHQPSAVEIDAALGLIMTHGLTCARLILQVGAAGVLVGHALLAPSALAPLLTAGWLAWVTPAIEETARMAAVRTNYLELVQHLWIDATITARDEVMAETALTHLATFVEQQQFLLVMGMAHVDGVVAHLEHAGLRRRSF